MFQSANACVGIVLVNVFGVVISGDAITLPLLIAMPLIIVSQFIALDGSGYMKQV